MRRDAAVATVLNGLGALAPQLIALFFLDSSLFGQFSVAYLGFAFATSLVFSLLCDAWVVLDSAKRTDSLKAYSRVLTTLCMIFGILSGIVTALFLDLAFGVLAASCITLATYRVGVRYLLVHSRNWRSAIVSDLLALVVTLAIFFIGSVNIANPLIVVMLAWSCGSLAGSMVGGIPVVGFSAAFSWMSNNRRTITPLVVDSLIMDVASIGTPFVLLPHLGTSGFGLYRAISNLGAPVRLLLTPMRPVILASSDRALSWRLTIVISCVSLVSGVAISTALLLLTESGLVIGVLSELGPFWAPAGLYGCATLLLAYYSLTCRSLGKSRILMLGRITHTSLSFIGPILGYIFEGLTGAIWAFSVAAILSALAWMFLAFYGGSGRRQRIASVEGVR